MDYISNMGEKAPFIYICSHVDDHWQTHRRVIWDDKYQVLLHGWTNKNFFGCTVYHVEMTFPCVNPRGALGYTYLYLKIRATPIYFYKTTWNNTYSTCRLCNPESHYLCTPMWYFPSFQLHIQFQLLDQKHMDLG